jgi:hypothetical protein
MKHKTGDHVTVSPPGRTPYAAVVISHTGPLVEVKATGMRRHKVHERHVTKEN